VTALRASASAFRKSAAADICSDSFSSHQAPPSAEQVRAAQAVFSQHSDANFAFGLLGVWTSTLLLHDLALETFSAPDDEEEERQPEAELA